MNENSQFRGALSAFRDTVTEWTAIEGGTVVPRLESFRPRSRRPPVRPLRWAFVGTITGILIVFPFYRGAIESRREAEALKDTLLLEQVNAYLTRSIAEPMQPFVELLSDDGRLLKNVDGGTQ